MDLPYSPTAGEGSDDSVTGNQWSWTLGDIQFNWFKQTIQNSNAEYKFVFSHQMTGGTPDGGSFADPGYVRGGAEAAAYFEWGGKNANGTKGFSDHRDSEVFGTTPIHQLMIESGISAYFHGHDHQYVYELRDGIVYQEVPSPSMTGSGFSGIYVEGNFVDYQTIEILPNSGHLRLIVNPQQATVEYVRSDQTAVSHTYTIYPADHCLLTAVGNGAWTSADNWDDGCREETPVTTSEVHIPDGFDITYDAEFTSLESLTVGSGGSLQFPNGGTLTVLTDLNNNGILDLGIDGNLDVRGRLINQGKLIQTKSIEPTESTESTFTFLDYGGYGGLRITANTQSLGLTTVEILGGQPCDSADTSVHRCFSIDPTNSVSSADVTFYIADSELNGSECDTVQAWRSLGGTNWTSAGIIGSPVCASDPYSVPYSNVEILNTESIFALRSTENPTIITISNMTANTHVEVNRWVITILAAIAVLVIPALFMIRKLVTRYKRRTD